jgi:parvulin-like peptidyl-prolyl isomerase
VSKECGKFFTPLTAAVLFGLAITTTIALSAEIIDRVLAVVGAVVITQSDVTAASTLGLVAAAEKDADPIQAVLSRLVDRQLILAEVNRYAPPEPTAAAVDQEVAAVRARFPSDAAYTAAFARTGMDDKQLRQYLHDDLRIREYLTQRFTVPPPTEEEIAQYYREHVDAFTRGGRTATLSDARPEIVRQLTSERRDTLIEDWMSGLRRRAIITNLYLPRQ